LGDFSGNAKGVDWQDIAMAGRAYADNPVGEPGVSKVMHMMAYEIDRLRSLTRFQDRVIRSGDTACLTQAEGVALERAAIAYELLPTEGARQIAETLVGLRERLSKGTPEQ